MDFFSRLQNIYLPDRITGEAIFCLTGVGASSLPLSLSLSFKLMTIGATLGVIRFRSLSFSACNSGANLVSFGGILRSSFTRSLAISFLVVSDRLLTASGVREWRDLGIRLSKGSSSSFDAFDFVWDSFAFNFELFVRVVRYGFFLDRTTICLFDFMTCFIGADVGFLAIEVFDALDLGSMMATFTSLFCFWGGDGGGVGLGVFGLGFSNVSGVLATGGRGGLFRGEAAVEEFFIFTTGKLSAALDASACNSISHDLTHRDYYKNTYIFLIPRTFYHRL